MRFFIGVLGLLNVMSLLAQSTDTQEQYTMDVIGDSEEIESVSSMDHISSLQDNDTIAEYDRLWLKELTNDTLFPQMRAMLKTPDSLADYDLSTDLLKSRLEELNRKTLFHIEYSPILEHTIKSFLKNRRKTFERLMSLSTYYFPMIEETLMEAHIPLEIKYLPIVESALNPKAKSPMGAVGLWQFMYTTGKRYGLEVNNYVDERADPVRSTKAAAKLLQKLYTVFGDWDLVLAAYNSGPGNVTKAMRRSGDRKNYWNLRPYLPKETAGYVPAFLATMYIFEYAAEHGFEPEHRENHFFLTDTVQVKRNVPFESVAKLTGLSEDEILFFNPSYHLKIIPFSPEKKYGLRLPVSEIGRFVAHEDQIYAQLDKEEAEREKPFPKLMEISPKALKGKKIHTVKKGEVLGKIASRYGVSLKNLKKWNHLKSNVIHIGQRLVIY